MKKKSRAPAKHILPAIALIFCGVAAQGISPALAGDTDISRWYRVDMIVFANQSSRAENEEKWRRDLGLRYPDNLQALYTEAEYLAKLCAAPAVEVPQTEPAFNEQTDDFQGWIEDRPASNENLLQQPVLHPDCLPQAQDGASTLDPVSLDAIAPSSQRVRQESAEVDSNHPPLPRPFILGDYNDPDLNRALTRLQRSGNFRPLFRGSWAQPMVNRENAPSLLIRGGQQYGDHYELEGFIRLGVERYLHIDTDLWLSRFASQSPSIEPMENADSSRSDWPQLPLPFLNTQQAPQAADEDEQLTTESEAFERERETEAEPGATHTIQRGGNIIIDSRSEAARQRLEQLQDSRPEYRVERTVVMRQQRRMRSNQLHYIDHPLFGVLVKITPLNQVPPWQEAEKD